MPCSGVHFRFPFQNDRSCGCFPRKSPRRTSPRRTSPKRTSPRRTSPRKTSSRRTSQKDLSQKDLPEGPLQRWMKSFDDLSPHTVPFISIRTVFQFFRFKTVRELLIFQRLISIYKKTTKFCIPGRQRRKNHHYLQLPFKYVLNLIRKNVIIRMLMYEIVFTQDPLSPLSVT